jgi:uncharacterized protein with HEPN domain
MPSSDPGQRFQDILDNIDLIRRYLSGTTKDDFATGGMTYDAVSYCFVRLTEAAIKLGDLAEVMAPEIPWGRIRGLGNQLRHAYDGINPDILWDAANADFPALEAACQAAMITLDKRS